MCVHPGQQCKKNLCTLCDTVLFNIFPCRVMSHAPAQGNRCLLTAGGQTPLRATHKYTDRQLPDSNRDPPCQRPSMVLFR